MRITIVTILLSIISVNCFADQNWIPYIPNQNIVVTIPTIEVQYVPQVNYYIPRQPILTHEWVPYYVNKPIIIEQRGLFCRHQYIMYQPVMEWFYRPVWK